MGILRSDIITHSSLEPTGSVLFDGNSDYLSWSDTSLKLGTSDFTLEAWINITSDTGQHQTIFMAGDSSDAGEMVFQVITAASGSAIGSGAARELGCRIAGGEAYSGFQITYGEWTHVACVRDGGTMTFFVNGVKGNSTAETENLTTAFTQVGARVNGGYNGYFNGYISNARIVLGALYKDSFTPSKFELENVPGTLLLCCQSSTSATTAAVIPSAITAQGTAAASAVAPDIRKDITDIGPTFADNTKFDTLSYMVPPGGTTAQRGRGRGVMGGFYAAPSYTTRMDYLNIQSLGNSIQFGNLSVAKIETASCSSSTRALWAGGSVPGPTTGGTKQNTIEYATIATTSNTIDFGDLTDTIRTLAGCSNGTRGVFGGGIDDPARLNTIDYVTIASTGNAADFGDLTVQRRNISSHSSTTRGIFAGGLDPGSPGYTDVIDYITIASTGNATDFGNLTVSRYGSTGCSNSTRGLFFGGKDPSAYANTIDYITIATTGDATDFGDLTVGRNEGAGFASPTRGIMAGGESPAVNTIDYVTIATIGNAKDFGDIFSAARSQSGSTDCHGGIS